MSLSLYKNPTILFSIILFAACHDVIKVDTPQPLPENSKTVHIKLADSLGNITLSIPARYDTSFSWTDFSDCGKPCDQIKYRFQPKMLRIIKETGFIRNGEPADSVERVTISHAGYLPFHDNPDTGFIFNYHQHKKRNIIQDPDTYKIKTDTVEKISDRYFSIIVVDLHNTGQGRYSKKILAATDIKGNMVEFTYELLTKQPGSLKDNFIQNSMFSLRTVRIKR